MLKILLVKTSSMGDVIHNLPVVTDIRRQFPDAVIDWVVEESFARIPSLHPSVRKVIPVALRRWRQSLGSASAWREMVAFNSALKSESYDMVLDTQGLIKSALVAFLARGKRAGYSWGSAWEPPASLLYSDRFKVDITLHAVERNRQLAGLALGYDPASFPLDYGIAAPGGSVGLPPPYAVLLHATSRDDKLWPEADWIGLGKQLADSGLPCVLPWGSASERTRSERLARAIARASVPDTLTLDRAAALLAHAAIVIGVDTGLTHLAAALGSRVVALYVATSPEHNGVYAGQRAINLGETGEPPAVTEVWQTATKLMQAEA